MTLLRSLIFYSFVVLYHSEASKIVKNDPIVDTVTGKVRGSVIRSDLTGEDYLAFKGITYAKPPVGNLRFEVKLKRILSKDSFFVLELFSKIRKKSFMLKKYKI